MVFNNEFRLLRLLRGSSPLCRAVNAAVTEQNNQELQLDCRAGVGGLLCLQCTGSCSDEWRQHCSALSPVPVSGQCQSRVWMHWRSEGWGLPWIHSSNQIDGNLIHKALVSLCLQEDLFWQQTCAATVSLPPPTCHWGSTALGFCVWCWGEILTVLLCTCCPWLGFSHTRDTSPKYYFKWMIQLINFGCCEFLML